MRRQHRLTEVVNAMLPYFTEEFGNPSSIYTFSQNNRAVIEKCRETVAKCLNAKAENIFFTSGGTESDNWALLSAAYNYRYINRSNGRGLKGHIITTRIEHHAIIHTAQYLESMGFDVTYLNVDECGTIRLTDLKRAIRKDTFIISVMFANNEIGTIEPIMEIGKLAHERGIIFHTDAVQAFGHIPIDVDHYNIDMLSASGHKFNGPKGTGFLYIRDGVNVGSFIHGGAQEKGKRAGTENVPGIAGLAKACEIALDNMESRIDSQTRLRDHLIERILCEIPYSRLNGASKNRLPNNINISFQFTEGEALLIMLDMAGVCASAGSACSSGLNISSHVLTAIGLPKDIADGALRLTIGHENTLEEIDSVVDIIKEAVKKLRAMSPVYEDFIKNKSIEEE